MAVLAKIQDTAGWVEAKINALAVYFTWFIEDFQAKEVFKQKKFCWYILFARNGGRMIFIAKTTDTWKPKPLCSDLVLFVPGSAVIHWILWKLLN